MRSRSSFAAAALRFAKSVLHAGLERLRNHQQPALAPDAHNMAHFRVGAQLARPDGRILAGGDEPHQGLGQCF
ncbi:MAG: hypothetical protein WBS22_00415 [Methylocystis sp.]